MDRQHATPILLTATGGVALELLAQHGSQATTLEAEIQALVHAHPEALPIEEIDPIFSKPVAICRELVVGKAGRVDNFLITTSGLPIIVECKLWRNPEARREVVAQILEYAKTLNRWTYDDLQREVSVRTGKGPDALLSLVRASDPTLDDQRFIDAVTFNLKRGRFLLLILGDGIREDVESLSSYLQLHAGIHFSFGLVEFPIYKLPNGEKLVVPRVVARTTSIVRIVVTVPEGLLVQSAEDSPDEQGAEVDPEKAALGSSMQEFWKEFLDKFLRLDDRAQKVPAPAKMGYISFMLPAPNGDSWLTVYRDATKGDLGVTLSASRNTSSETAMNAAVQDWDVVGPELGGTARVIDDHKYGRQKIGDRRNFGDFEDPLVRRVGFEWLAERVNTFVNVFRPRIRDAVADDAEG